MRFGHLNLVILNSDFRYESIRIDVKIYGHANLTFLKRLCKEPAMQCGTVHNRGDSFQGALTGLMDAAGGPKL
jgi:hypothetical protein